MTNKERADEQQSIRTPSHKDKQMNCHMKAGNHNCQMPCVCHLVGGATGNFVVVALAATLVAISTVGAEPNLVPSRRVVSVFVHRQYAVHLPTNQTRLTQ